MTVSIMTPAGCERLALNTLGLGQTGADLFSREGIAASHRRAASFLCPCPPRQIVDAVLEVLRPLRPETDLLREEVVEVLDLLVAGGDLVELRQGELRTTRLIFLGPPTYVVKEPGRYLIAGVRPFGEPLIDADSAEVIYEAHMRTIVIDPATAATEQHTLGLQEVPQDAWAGRPAKGTAANLIGRVKVRLDVAGRSAAARSSNGGTLTFDYGTPIDPTKDEGRFHMMYTNADNFVAGGGTLTIFARGPGGDTVSTSVPCAVPVAP